MGRKKKNTISKLSILKNIFFVMLGVSIVWGVCYVVSTAMNNSPYFRVQTIVIDPALVEVDKKDLISVKGKSIFQVNISQLQNSLSRKYPDISELSVIRRFPDQLYLTAKKRIPFVQVVIKGKYYALDSQRVILMNLPKKDALLPQINGVESSAERLDLGRPLRGADVLMAVQIAQEYSENPDFTGVSILDINVSNLSKIIIQLSNNIEVYIDRDKISYNLRKLGVMLTQAQINLNEVKYIDLRFKEPILGKK